MCEIQKSYAKHEKKSDLWKTMFNRVVNYLPENEVNLVKTSTEIERLNLLADDINEKNTSEEHKNSLKSTITQLNNNNFNLKIQLERLKEANKKELENMNRIENLDREKLQNDMNQLRAMHAHELKIQAKTQSELKKELENLKVRLEFEQNQKEELKKRFTTEFNAVKVRFDNELNKQNMLMQNKYEELVNEIRRLNDVIKQLKQEKDELKTQIQREKDLNRHIIEHRETTLTPKLEKRFDYFRVFILRIFFSSFLNVFSFMQFLKNYEFFFLIN